MNKISTTILALLNSFFILSGVVKAQTPTAAEILTRADSVANAPRDMHVSARMLLTDARGNERTREVEIYQQGTNKRLVRFLAPANQKGIGFLALPEDVNYLYLPAFRNIRRIAPSIRNQNFAGTDFSYQDLSSSTYAEDYDPKLLQITDEFYLLEMTPNPETETDYGKVKAWIRKDNYYPVKFEFYDRTGALWKVLQQNNLDYRGQYWIAREMVMQDVQKKHSTKNTLTEISLDDGLGNEIFTPRFLRRFR
ncbi:MAG TPA: outer membrane lipoprotein-sorting protein [bacterium]|nr:outer membrane lipoprotein-sorting protein [bacterium]